MVLDFQRDPIVSRGLDELLEEARFVIEPVTEEQARLARRAYADFRQGQRARQTRAAALEGDDFVHTTIRSALEEK